MTSQCHLMQMLPLQTPAKMLRGFLCPAAGVMAGSRLACCEAATWLMLIICEQVLAALGRKLGAADVTKVTDKLLDDRGRKKLAELIAGGNAVQATGGALSR